jgi:hypothetical protein
LSLDGSNVSKIGSICKVEGMILAYCSYICFMAL